MGNMAKEDIMTNRDFIEIAKRNRLQPGMLRDIMKSRNRGMNNSDVAKYTGLSRGTVNKYVMALRTINDRDLRTLHFVLAIGGADRSLLTYVLAVIEDRL